MAKRIFVAAEICDSLKHDICSHAEKIFKGCKNIRITPEENLHITLKFIGDTGEDQVEAINKAVRDSVYCHKSFDYTLKKQIEAFPRLDRARIAYMGLEDGCRAFCRLFQSLEEELAGLGLEKEKRGFQPHITAARIKKPCDISGKTGEAFTPGSRIYRCSHVSVYESILDRRGARYMILERFVLK